MQKADEVSGQGDKIVNHHSHQTHAPVDRKDAEVRSFPDVLTAAVQFNTSTRTVANYMTHVVRLSCANRPNRPR